MIKINRKIINYVLLFMFTNLMIVRAEAQGTWAEEKEKIITDIFELKDYNIIAQEYHNSQLTEFRDLRKRLEKHELSAQGDAEKEEIKRYLKHVDELILQVNLISSPEFRKLYIESVAKNYKDTIRQQGELIADLLSESTRSIIEGRIDSSNDLIKFSKSNRGIYSCNLNFSNHRTLLEQMVKKGYTTINVLLLELHNPKTQSIIEIQKVGSNALELYQKIDILSLLADKAGVMSIEISFQIVTSKRMSRRQLSTISRVLSVSITGNSMNNVEFNSIKEIPQEKILFASSWGS